MQELIVGWRERGHRIGFGVGLAKGPATVGRIGYESRFDYTAIGSVVNLAARLCASAADRDILTDLAIAEAVDGRRALDPRGSRLLKGYDDELPVFGMVFEGRVQSGLRGALSRSRRQKRFRNASPAPMMSLVGFLLRTPR